MRIINNIYLKKNSNNVGVLYIIVFILHRYDKHYISQYCIHKLYVVSLFFKIIQKTNYNINSERTHIYY